MKKNVIGRAGTAFALVGALALAGCSGSSAPSEDAVSSVLDPSDPVQVELWTYYNGTQQQAFEDLVKDFNATKGKDLGIVVTSSSQGGVNDLASAVTDSAQELVGSEAMPDAFLVYCFRHFSRSGRALYLPFQIWDKGRVEGGGR
ncbi:MAG: hypothetical protein E7J12_05575, partial [Eggerthella sp.]|nr:hypothetical protein [Eggerthella sp.]